MDQVSRPLQVALVATLAFVALWFLALRPKEEEIPPPPKPPAQAGAQGGNSAIPGGLGNAVDKARAGQAQANQSAQRRSRQGENPEGTSQPSPAPSQGTAPAPARPASSRGVGGTGASGGRRFAASVSPAQVNAALGSGKVVVLLFYNRLSSDDRAVRAELASLSRRSGRVLVGDAPLREVARYPSLTQGVQILQSPTVVVVNRRRRAQLLVGYTDRFELDQKVANALSAR